MIRAVQPARLYTTEFFILEKCGPNPWAHIPGFAVDRIWEDYLHVVDLALAPDACASASRVQVYLVHGMLLGILHRPEATSLVIPWSPNPFNLNHERPPLNLNPDRHCWNYAGRRPAPGSVRTKKPGWQLRTWNSPLPAKRKRSATQLLIKSLRIKFGDWWGKA